MKTVLRLSAFLLIGCAIASAQSIQFPYRGLDYLMVSKDGITVMIAPMKLSILSYSAAHVWVTNGSKRTIHVEPQHFVGRARGPRQAQPADFAALSDAEVVKQAMDRARLNDILAMVKVYEQNLYGFRNDNAINYYQARKQMAASEGGGKRFRAGAMVSAILFAKTDIPPGEFREGTIFFSTPDKKPEFVSFTARIAGLQFNFTPSPERSPEQ